MLRCFSSLGCPDSSLDQTLVLATTHGIAAVELRTLGGSVDLPAYFAAHFGTPAGLAAHLRTAHPSLRIAAFDLSLHLVGPTAAERDQLLAAVPWAEAAGVRWLRVFDGGRHADATELAEAIATLDWWQDLRRRHSWTAQLMIETHDSLFTAAAIGRLIQARPDAAILWDSHHTWRKGGEDPVKTWPAIRANVVHIHVKDSIPVPSAKHPFTYVLPGDGGFPIAPLLAALEADAFAGLVSFEWEKMWHPYLPPLDQALRTAAERRWW